MLNLPISHKSNKTNMDNSPLSISSLSLVHIEKNASLQPLVVPFQSLILNCVKAPSHNLFYKQHKNKQNETLLNPSSSFCVVIDNVKVVVVPDVKVQSTFLVSLYFGNDQRHFGAISRKKK